MLPLALMLVGCARPVPRRPRVVQTRVRAYVDVAAVARRHPLWQATPDKKIVAPSSLRALSSASPLKVPPMTFSSAAPEATPSSHTTPPSDEPRRAAQQQESQAVQEMEDDFRQFIAQHAETEIKNRLAKQRALENATIERQLQELSPQLDAALSRLREQEFQQFARAAQPRRLRLASPGLSPETRQKLQAELEQLERDAQTRLEQKKQQNQKRLEEERVRLTESMNQHLKDLEQSLRDEMKTDLTLTSHREQLARDFASKIPEAVSEAEMLLLSFQLDAPMTVALKEPAFSARAELIQRAARRRQSVQKEVSDLRAHLLNDTAARVRQLARERGWELVEQKDAPDVADKTQECIRTLREETWQMMNCKR